MRIFIFTLAALLGLFSCGKNRPSKCDVIVSIPPYLYFVDRLTDGELKAASLVPAGANPHLYEPSPKQVSETRLAKAWIRIGEEFEKKIAISLGEKNPNLIVLNLQDELVLPKLPDSEYVCSHCSAHHTHKERIDLHFWLSLRLAGQQADLIAEALWRAFPERKKQIEKNLISLRKNFESADLIISQKLHPYQGDVILVSHPAFGYFCFDYDLKQISIESEGKDPLPKQISAILKSVANTPIRTVLTQAQYNNKGAEIMADTLHLKTREVNPYSADYLKNFFYIAECIENP